MFNAFKRPSTAKHNTTQSPDCKYVSKEDLIEFLNISSGYIMKGNGHWGIVSTKTNVSREVFRNFTEILTFEKNDVDIKLHSYTIVQFMLRVSLMES